ncbi:Transposase [Labrenzia sp. THAF82]|uniref:transposase n=1 Tax=Labrenzia sp. THAF82 TaxID=2587861 RepID=UPI0012692A4B|nr:transposase [Labrenzia sp. THAF82]QFT29506.1 Transposase [Labrenzia sp. THAF82]
MTKQTRRRFTPEYKEQGVARLSEDGVTYASLAGELGVTSSQLKSWHLELLAAGSAAALAQSQVEAAELTQLRCDNKRLKEENEVMRKASAFFAQWAAKT